ncbi:MAG TPA: acyl carrier protein [Candidatus Eisenbacteria bacterium]|nr:acyl carrier protein [Candidatus Eisenbacteria bacterium]
MNNILSEEDTKAVLDILVEQLGVEQAQLTPDARLEEDLGADSLTLVEITLALEECLNLSIPDQEWEKVTTVGNLFEALADLLGKPELRRP